ncbi:MAG: hypothetical protein ACI38O_11210 [Fibrobacter intestinalis]|uniref:Uncharacterized protein n=1 Tax=Fibrobacter intestinalis TaxID=28122 RepID=A0A1T4N867_9BACT|nr:MULTISPECIES: hypothetical protein [Fibrobacter]PBC66764.1 hypothetical protein BGX14_2395 [Fibrobacter sp. UWS1]PBC75159.1 hypothetical protein BGW94_2842 [Fibrobacter sp. NR9]SJZ75325.1 hypothetical protein SAMN02745108_01502 [Fibrobacter intestinalis]
MIEYYPDSIYYPRETVEAKYKKGELAKVEERLMGFAERHKNRVWIISKEDSSEPSNEVLLDNLRAYLLVRGSLQPAADMADLIKEINKEVWYRNEEQKGKENPQEVAINWEEQYEKKWRQARMFEAFVLIDICKDKLIQILRTPGK